MRRKILSFVIVFVISVVSLTNVVSAQEVSVYDLYTKSTFSTLTISGTTATCKSDATGYSGTTTKIVIAQTLQKKTSTGTWSKVKAWSETDTGSNGSATNYAYSLSTGTYRLKSVFTVYAGSKYETITKYSSRKTI